MAATWLERQRLWSRKSSWHSWKYSLLLLRWPPQWKYLCKEWEVRTEHRMHTLLLLSFVFCSNGLAALIKATSSTPDAMITPAPLELIKRQDDRRKVGWYQLRQSWKLLECSESLEYCSSKDHWVCCTKTPSVTYPLRIATRCSNGIMTYPAVGTLPEYTFHWCVLVVVDISFRVHSNDIRFVTWTLFVYCSWKWLTITVPPATSQKPYARLISCTWT